MSTRAAVAFTPQAERDIEPRLEYLRARNPRAAGAFVAELGALLEVLAEGKLDGAEMTLRNGRRVRRWALPPMVVFYERHPAVVRIVRVFHAARRPIVR